MTTYRREHTWATAVPEHEMLALLADSVADPLLPDRFPVPVRYDGRWWHQPAEASASDFVPVPDDQASRYDDLLLRHRKATGAARRDASRPDG